MMNLLPTLLAYFFQVAPGPVVACVWRAPQSFPAAARPGNAQAYFALTLSQNGQEIENQYLGNNAVFARVLQYLNYDIAQDVFLRPAGQFDSVAAVAVSYPRQYGTTGRSTVLLVFPVAAQQLRRGCCLTFRGERLELGTRRFCFSAQDIQAVRRRPAIAQ